MRRSNPGFDFMVYGIASLFGMPRAVILFRILHLIRASLAWISNIMACKLSPKIFLNEKHGDMLGVIAREKQIKSGSRKKKLALIEAMNPKWLDLYSKIL